MKLTQLFLVGFMSMAAFSASADTLVQNQEQVEQNLQLQKRVGPEVPKGDHAQQKNEYQNQIKNRYQLEEGQKGQGLKSEKDPRKEEKRVESRSNGGMNAMGGHGSGGGKH